MAKIAILGAGPSGLFAAHACAQYGHSITIFDKNPSSTRQNAGVFYIHANCDLLLDEEEIKQIVLGTLGKSEEEIAKEYGQKVYKQNIPKVSILEALHRPTIVGYNAVQAINRLWYLYEEFIKITEIKGFNDISLLLNKFDKIISTIPAQILFPNHNYEFVTAWLSFNQAPLEEQSYVFYSISPTHSWYRMSSIFDSFVTEYPGHYYNEIDNFESFIKIKKVIKVTPELPKIENLFLVGRYGAWDKSCLSHDAYYRTLDWLKGRAK